MALIPLKPKHRQDDPNLCANLRCRRGRSDNELGLCSYHQAILESQYRRRNRLHKARSGWEE